MIISKSRPHCATVAKILKQNPALCELSVADTEAKLRLDLEIDGPTRKRRIDLHRE